VLEKLTQQLAAARALMDDQVHHAVEQLTDEKVPADAKADFLVALARKGESPEEIAAFARALRDKSIQPPIEKSWREAHDILDVVGTGGDRLSTFNISTTVAILCTAAGVFVAKHGNRAVTSSVGSADVVEQLGIRVDLSPAEAARALREHGFAFFFAPNFHPAFKNVAAARKLCAERGQRTIFNILGPLLNPARPSALLVGVPRPELCEPMARALQSLGARRVMVVCGEVSPQSKSQLLDKLESLRLDKLKGPPEKVRVVDTNGKSLGVIGFSETLALAKERNAVPIVITQSSNPPICRLVDDKWIEKCVSDHSERKFLDELSTLGKNHVAEFYQERGLAVSTFSPEQFPLQPATLTDLRGGDKFVNAEITRRILQGDERGPKRDAVLLNAAAALFVAGKTKSLAEGWEVAAGTIDSGKARAKLAELAG
jgi:anthranilate phosphoribosyltransferase